MKLTMQKYQELAMRTAVADGRDRIDEAILGLIGETGEIVDVYKKWIYQSCPDTLLPKRELMEEMGDVLWYMAELADGLDIDMDSLAGRDFASLDAWAQKPTRNPLPLRRIILSLNQRANRLRRCVERHEKAGIQAEYRKLLLGVARLAWFCDYTMCDVAMQNIKKLTARYPDGFDAEISAGRYR